MWKVSEPTSLYGGCPLFHLQWPLSVIECGSFHGHAMIQSPIHCYVSILTVNVTEILNGTIVNCLFAQGRKHEKRGSGVLWVIGMLH